MNISIALIGLALLVGHGNGMAQPMEGQPQSASEQSTWLNRTGPTVVLFFSYECPICNDLAFRLNALMDVADSVGARILLVYPDYLCKKSRIGAFHRRHGFRPNGFSYLIDEGNEMALRLNATTTPQVFVLDSTGCIRYSGLVDDRYLDVGVRQAHVKRNYVAEALRAIGEGREMDPGTTIPKGCLITF
jgi:peroxiredoxin